MMGISKIRKFVISILNIRNVDDPLRQGQFVEYAVRDYLTHWVIIFLLIILAGIQFLQAFLFLQ